MNTTAEVYLWGTRIGIVHQEIQKKYASFEYDAHFLHSGIELSPIKMPLGSTVYEFPGLAGAPFWGLPGLLTDSLPDTFGNKVIEQWLKTQGSSLNEFTAIDRLCYTGKRGMGALEYVPAKPLQGDIDENIHVSEMVHFASDILNDRASVTLNAQDELTYSQLVQVGSSAGGARAKALIAWNETTNEVKSGQLNLGDGFEYWLMKFDCVSQNGDHGIEDIPEYTLIEYAYYQMASDSGINMNECRLYKVGNENHFMTKRFDRDKGQKIHMQSLGALAHINYNEPCLCSYEMAVQYMRKMNLPAKDIEQFYRRMVFNCLGVNQDDHVKNVSFLMDRAGTWRLSPAYDITFSYNPDNVWLRAHQMTINQKNRDITMADLLKSGEEMGLKRKKCEDIIKQIAECVDHFEVYAAKNGIKEKTANEISQVLRKNRVFLECR